MHAERKESLSLDAVNGSVEPETKKGWRRLLAYFGPAFLISVGYMDPGNWATDLQGGAQFGYRLIWILFLSNMVALLLQGLSARLGIVRKRDLAQANREVYPRVVNFCLYLLAEIAIAACDLAEVLGMALGLHLLCGLPLIWGVCLTVLDTLVMLWLQNLGIRKLEAFIVSLVAFIGISFLIQLCLAHPDAGALMRGFVPHRMGKDELYIAVGIIGATVMPHNLYLHSSLVQTRHIGRDPVSIGKAIRFNLWDSAFALNAAFLVNTAILVLAASVFYVSGHHEVARIEDAYHLLDKLLGSRLSPILFSVALIASGQSSTITGTLAGQIVMEGYLRLRINPWLRRLLTRLLAIIPTILVLLLMGDSQMDNLLILSQVILSIQLGFAVIPLIYFVSDKKSMGSFAIGLKTKILSWLIAAVLGYLNLRMVYTQVASSYSGLNIFWQILIMLGFAFFMLLFLIMTIYPLIRAHPIDFHNISIHADIAPLFRNLNVIHRRTRRIAVALDFSNNDENLISNAVSLGAKDADYLLLHIVESAPARYFGSDSDDIETNRDKERLELYKEHLTKLGYHVQICLGFQNRIREIVKIVRVYDADILVMGAHRHSGLKDYLYGETIESVRHELKIPVLIVNV